MTERGDDATGTPLYAELDGLRLYYEASGQGDPLVLLHGALGGAHVFGGQLPAFAERYRVLVPEQRGRGRTPDVDGPISYDLLAEDVVAFLERVVREPTHLVGVSDGGVVGILVAMRRPDLLRRLVIVGSHFHRDGIVGGEMWTDAAPDDEVWAGPRRRYEDVSPDGPQHFPVVFAKLQRMWREEPTLTAADLASIPIPVLVMAGDDDVVRHDHSVALYEALPHGQLAIIPGTSHAVFMEKPEILNRIVLDFLAEEGEPRTILPVRRAPGASA